jgi:uncharacterized membrane protein YeaQ/YmgE (transglycosylase-associated protein family)
MELLFIILIGAGIGFLAQFTIPGRDKRGALLLASISAAVAAAVCVGLLWLSFTYDGGWIWVISLVAGGVVALILAGVLPRRRRVADRAMLTKLSGGRA